MNNLLRSYCTSGNFTVAHDGTKTSLAAFKSDPSQLCYQLEAMTIESVGRQLVIKIQVTHRAGGAWGWGGLGLGRLGGGLGPGRISNAIRGGVVCVPP